MLEIGQMPEFMLPQPGPLAVRALLVFSLLLTPAFAHALWLNAGNPICVATGDQRHPVIVGDGAGGAIIAWSDKRSSSADIYAQHITASGSIAPGWPTDGIAVAPSEGDQSWPMIASDGAGGAIITWLDYRSGRYGVYAQRVTFGGTTPPTWPASGTQVWATGGNQIYPSIVSDGSHGAVIAWGSGVAYAQGIDSTGAIRWASEGVQLANGSNVEASPPAIASDGDGGAIVTWSDGRTYTWPRIYAQRVQHDGSIAGGWPSEGLALTPDYFYGQDQPAIATDDSGGAIITWSYYIGGSGYSVRAVKVTAAGQVIGPETNPAGIPVCPQLIGQERPSIAADALGGAIVVWMDSRPGSQGADIYGQRLSQGMQLLWGDEGVSLCSAPNNQYPLAAVSDGQGGAIAAWSDQRNLSALGMWAQRVTQSGTIAPNWTADGMLVSWKNVGVESPPALTSDDAGGAIVAWEARRTNPIGYDIFAQHIPAEGTVVGVAAVTLPSELLIEAIRPNPSRGAVTISFSVPNGSEATVSILDLQGRLVSQPGRVGGFGPGFHSLEWDGSAGSVRVPTGIYFVVANDGKRREVRRVVVVR
jgi:hypothetical protein